MRSWQDFDLVLVRLPLFLFSATFFPLSTYPRACRRSSSSRRCTAGVHARRALTTGHVDAMILVDVAYLAVMGLLGLVIVARRLHLLLLK